MNAHEEADGNLPPVEAGATLGTRPSYGSLGAGGLAP